MCKQCNRHGGGDPEPLRHFPKSPVCPFVDLSSPICNLGEALTTFCCSSVTFSRMLYTWNHVVDSLLRRAPLPQLLSPWDSPTLLPYINRHPLLPLSGSLLHGHTYHCSFTCWREFGLSTLLDNHNLHCYAHPRTGFCVNRLSAQQRVAGSFVHVQLYERATLSPRQHRSRSRQQPAPSPARLSSCSHSGLLIGDGGISSRFHSAFPEG